MAQGRGYVCIWNVGDVGGIIHVCEGDTLVGDDVAFAFTGCAKAVRDILNGGNIADAVECPPPSGSLKVAFDFDLVNGLELAVNVRL
ncbi:MAG TPA: hypothetical protein VFZ44_14940 [Pyrinomonadaceae bacterium]